MPPRRIDAGSLRRGDDVDEDVDGDLRDHRSSGAASDRARRWAVRTVRAGPGLARGADARVVRAADTDRGERHAVLADRPAALRAGDEGLAVRMAVAVLRLAHRALAYPRARSRRFTPDEAAAAPTGVVIDVIRATSTICQALDAGYERVWCAAEVEDARALAGDGVTLGGERLGVRIDGFDLGNSPREYLEPRTPTLAMSTTNGTRAIVTAAERCDRVLIASLLNLAAVTRRPARTGRTWRSSAPA